MLKRITSIALILMILLCAFSVPVSAAVNDSGSVEYYVVGTMSSWGVKEEYKMSLNEDADETEYVLTADLNSGEELKCVKVREGVIVAWYPDGELNYGARGEIDASGKYTIRFRPGRTSTSGWYCGFILVEESVDFDPNLAVVRIKSEDEDNVYNYGYTVNWYEEGSDEIIFTGFRFSGIDRTKSYQFEIILEEDLGRRYYQPARQTLVLPPDSSDITVPLKRINTIKLSGQIRYPADVPGRFIPSVKLIQTYSGGYTVQKVVKIDSNLKIDADIDNVPSELVITREGFEDKTLTALSEPISGRSVSLGNIVMTPVESSGYYVVGYMTDWSTDPSYKMEKVADSDKLEYTLTADFLADDEIKCVWGYDGGCLYWYPGEFKNYVIDSDGTYTVRLRPDGDGDSDWYCNYILCVQNIVGSLKVALLDDSGQNISSGYTVKWYEKGSDNVIGTGTVINGVEDGKEYEYEVELGEELSYLYAPPQRRDAVAQDGSSEIRLTLERLGKITVSGKVVDGDSKPVSGATVKLEQLYGGSFNKTVTVSTNSSGQFSAEITNVPTDAVITASGFYERTKAASNSDTPSGTAVSLGSVTLAPLPNDKIEMSLSVKPAALQGAQAEPVDILSDEGLSFSLYNLTKDREIAGFTVQYPYIYLSGADTSAGDSVRIDVTDDAQSMAPASVTVVLGERGTADCELELVENGRLTLSSVNGCDECTMMLFDDPGEFILSADAYTGYVSSPLPAGSYTAVFVQQSELLRCVGEISKLDEMGLEANTDYILRSVVIKNGEIASVPAMTIPELDESRLYYTVPYKTKITVSDPCPVIGRYITVRCEFKIDEKHTSSGEKITFELSDGVEIAKNSLTLDGAVSAYSLEENKLTVTVNKSEGVIRFYAVATDDEDKNITAYLSFDNAGSRVTQPLGAAGFTPVAERFTVPGSSCEKTVTASGTTAANSTVTVYDNDVEVGSVRSNKRGSWSIDFELDEPDKTEYHVIRLKIENENLSVPIYSEEQVVYYNNELTQLSKVTMINTYHEEGSGKHVENNIVLDFIHPSSTAPTYRFWPSYPQFTFKAEFEGDPSEIGDVSVVVKDSNNKTIYVPMSYDSKAKIWVGSKAISGAVASIGVAYTNRFASVQEMTMEHLAGIKVKNIRKTDNVTSFDLVSGGQTYKATGYPIAERPASVPGKEKDYAALSSASTSDSFTIKYNKTENCYIVITEESFIIARGTKDKGAMAAIGADDTDLADTGYMVTVDSLGLNGVSAQQLHQMIDNMLNELENGDCDYDYPEAAAQAMRDQLRARGAYMMGTAIFAGLNAANTGSNFNPRHPILTGLITLNELSSVHEPFESLHDQADANFRYMLNVYDELTDRAGCHPQPQPQPEPEPLPVRPSWDPSGYVYEAVPSNRLEGVKAEAYVLDYEYDDFGVPSDERSDVFWDAEEYDQLNPLYTDANGEYAWDVPDGSWLVKFSKQGYYDADSRTDQAADPDGYLPVPPPQTEVNVGMVSKAVPTVKEVSVYENEIRIAFSQYMQPDTVNGSSVTVTMDSKEISGSVTPLNEEYDYEQVNKYASVFLFVPDEKLTSEVVIRIKGAKNYADKAMTSEYSAVGAPHVRPESIDSPDSVTVDYDSGALLSVDIKPASAGKELTLYIESSSPSVLGVANSTAVTDSDGHANIMLLGNLPGECEITISVGGTDLTKTVAVKVNDPRSGEVRCEKVKSNYAAGSVIKKGTQIILSTDTDGAEIYYTTDGTCPCTVDSPSRIRYTGPVTVDEDTFLIAYAVKDGMLDSYTAGYVYTVRTPLLGDVDGDGEVTIIDATYIQRYLASIPLGFDFDEDVADTDDDGEVSILDATFIQRWLVSLSSNESIGKPVG